MEQKKAQLGNLQGIIIVLVIVGILLAAGFFIFDEFQNQLDNTANAVTSENNSATVGIAYLNATGYTVADAGEPCFNTFAVTSATNRSNNTAIGSTLFEVNANTGLVNSTSSNWNNVSISYTYKDGGTACKGISDTTIAMLTIPNLLGLIVLIAVIGVILAVVFNVIPGSRSQGA